LHLMYKALFEMSKDRPEFLSRLFSRPRPESLTASSNIRDILTAFAPVARDDKLFEANFTAIIDHLEKTRHFPLSDLDVKGIRFVYEFFGENGPDLTYWMSGGFGGRGGRANSPTFGDLMTGTDEAG